MARGLKCTICRHPDRTRIELGRAAGASLDSLAKKFKVSRDAIQRHWHGHVTAEAKAGYLAGPAQLDALAQRAAEESDSVLDYLRIIRTTLLSSMTTCNEMGDGRAVATVATALLGCLEKIGKITGQIAELAHGTTNINVALIASPEFLNMQAAMLRALAPYPDARAAVIETLQRLDAEQAKLPAPPITIEAMASHAT